MGSAQVEVEVHLDADAGLASAPSDIRTGLSRSPKQLPSKYFYDERGSELFEQITRLEEYYPTRTEQGLLERAAPEIARLTRARELIELGAGAARKTAVLIEALIGVGSLERYVPFEVSEEITRRTADRLARAYPGLAIHAVVGDYGHHLERIPVGERRLVAFLGGTIGNFTPDEAAEFLSGLGQVMPGKEDWLLLGTDLVKNVSVLEAAYNDSLGVTAEFNRNILNVLNSQLDGDLDPAGFEHVAFFNERLDRIEMHLRSLRDQSARLEALDVTIEFEEGEQILTEVSCKYRRSTVERLLTRAGFRLEHWFTDENEYFGLSLARRVTV